MASLLISMAIDLKDYKLPEHLRPDGPLFYRWLPNGEADSIELPIDDLDMELKVWFERRGFLHDDQFLVYDGDRKEVDSNVVSHQAKLEAGPLFGQLRIANISQADIDVLVKEKIGDQQYIDLGKRILKAIFPPLSQLINLLRINYGQYWIRDIESWDSLHESLGSYCRSNMQISWSVDEGQNWKPFQPTPLKKSLTVILVDDKVYERYLHKEDYLKMGEQLQQISEPSLAAITVASSHRILDGGNLRHAFVEGVIALELAIHEFVRAKVKNSETLLDDVGPFWKLSLRAQLISIVASYGQIPQEDLERAVEAIKIRNRIVHYGFDPFSNPDHTQIALSLLKVASSLLPGPEFRFAKLNTGNKLYPANN